MGSGVSSIIDFQPESEGIRIPMQIGLHSQKTLNPNSFIDIGLSYATKGMRKFRIEEISNGLGTIYKGDAYEITIHSIELSIKYYKSLNLLTANEVLYYFGLTCAYLPVNPTFFAGRSLYLSDEYFREFYPLITDGFSIKLTDRLRTDIGVQFFILPLIKKDYIPSFTEKSDYFGSYSFPVGIDISMNYSFK